MKILIVEDSSKTRTLLATHLKAKSFAVDTAEDGKEGLQLIKSETYDLIILDLALPFQNGKELLVAAKNKSTTPIIILSGHVSPSDNSMLFDLGAHDVITKPFSVEEVLARVHAILRRQKIVTHNPIVYKDIILDYDTSTLRYKNDAISLTRSEFLFIEILLQNPSQPVSRQHIFAYVWDTDDQYSSNIVETHLLNIRKKLTAKNLDLITTIPGKGYKIAI